MAETGFIHDLNPVMLRLGSMELYYYGLAYSIGFLGIHLWLRRRKVLGWDLSDVYNFSILFSLCVLLFGRLFSVFVYHWEYYREHILQLFDYRRGGMATHGVLLGGLVSILLFSRLRKTCFWQLADEIVIPAALLLALGRVGNFINGQICGRVTSAWWGVKFPNMEGFRHPVTLYESLKNLLLIPILLYVRRTWPMRQGLIAANFIFWYGFLRIFTDLFRDHGALLLGIGLNQYFNALMALCGVLLMFFLLRKSRPQPEKPLVIRSNTGKHGLWGRRFVFCLVILFSLVIRSAWTPEVLQQRRDSRKAVQIVPEANINLTLENSKAVELTSIYSTGAEQ